MSETPKQKNGQIAQIREIIREKLVSDRSSSQESNGLMVAADWSIGRMLKIEDTREFVSCGYEVILNRRADISGMREALRTLTSDNASKVTWLMHLRYSEEGRRAGKTEESRRIPCKSNRRRRCH